MASGHATSNADVIAAIESVEPECRIELPPAVDPGPASWRDVTRLRADTGFAPRYDTSAAAADYIAWLRDAHDR